MKIEKLKKIENEILKNDTTMKWKTRKWMQIKNKRMKMDIKKLKGNNKTEKRKKRNENEL